MPESRPGTWESLRAALGSRRIRAVTLQSFSSGLPLGLVWIALPAYLTYRGVDIRTVGLFSLAQTPWSFKFLWSPLMDRFGPRFAGPSGRAGQGAAGGRSPVAGWPVSSPGGGCRGGRR